MKKLHNAEIVDVDFSTIHWKPILESLYSSDVPYWKMLINVEDWKKQLLEMKNDKDTTDDGEQVTSYRQFFQEWIDAGIDHNNIRLYNYFPNDHYSYDSVEKIFCEKLDIQFHKAWISRLDPGCWVPWHWDVEANPKNEFEFERYSMFINGPHIGHTFMLGRDPETSDCFYSLPHGTIIKWNSYKEWHAGGNLGFEPKWLYHFIGRRKENLNDRSS